MNIAHILPYSARFPLTKHNGRYEWALRLAKRQSDDGHDVTIYCGPSGLEESPRLCFDTIDTSLDRSEKNNHSLFIRAFGNKQHDVYHSHFDDLHYSLAKSTKKPIVVTQHWFPTEKIAHAAASRPTNVHTVPVTRYMSQENQRLGIPSSELIYHGIDLKLFGNQPRTPGDRLLFVGRIAPHKGVKELVETIALTDESLDIVGKINDRDLAYWQSILPFVDDKKIRYLGGKSQLEVANLMSTTKAFVFLPAAPEAFGQTIIEAQACGTPVIVNDIGANRELLDDGVSGVLLKGDVSFTQALEKLQGIKTVECRRFAEKFDITVMTRQYESLYKSLITKADPSR